eukprot:2810958-Pleurochrysis_carterae.AAC.1
MAVRIRCGNAHDDDEAEQHPGDDSACPAVHASEVFANAISHAFALLRSSAEPRYRACTACKTYESGRHEGQTGPEIPIGKNRLELEVSWLPSPEFAPSILHAASRKTSKTMKAGGSRAVDHSICMISISKLRVGANAKGVRQF